MHKNKSQIHKGRRASEYKLLANSAENKYIVKHTES